MTQLKALIFDVDGTLAETERDGHRVAFNRAFSEAGLDWNWSIDLYGKLLEVSGGKERISYYLQQYCSDVNEDLYNLIPQLHQAKTHHYLELLSSGEIELRLGVKRLIEEAYNKGIRLAIATTSALPNALALLEKHLDPDWFEVIAAGDIVTNKKPSPEIYNYVLDKLNLEPGNCLVFEDSYQGLQAASQANLTTVITRNNYTKHQDFAQATLVLEHLGELDQPFTVIQGNVTKKHYFDLELAYNLVNR
ncbi:HAD family hydrolase [Crocosphaera sp. XPORK-15E]|uniref:HAD family hydrolase n=1 Tax=Crocosphaera sp. XPORK-15E TaxID=3110247 RepID=UPI002B1F0D66|nr:HAD family hydrolase [Crocosphaera sp. XPORK-15E]MEA5534189.1 HAD family hydrolase [Crocosphaera sp. XPORK-15E]